MRLARMRYRPSTAAPALFALQELGAWASTEMVRRYAHLAADHLAPYAERLIALPAVEKVDGTNTAQA